MKKFHYFAMATVVCLMASCEPIEPATSSRVTTGTAENVTTNSATLHGNINIDLLEYESVNFGIMISNNLEDINNRTGLEIEIPHLIGTELTLELTELFPGIKYYYCTWLLLNNQQYEFGSIEQFTTGSILGGGEFSVSPTKKIIFSLGNLQYKAHTNKWRFAPYQYCYIGDDNLYFNPSDNDYIDLFAWGTGDNPLDSIKSDFIDWGINITSPNDSIAWRTLSKDEWQYLILQRPNADSLIATAQVDGVNGLVLLPDHWAKPQEVTFKVGFSELWGSSYYAQNNTLNASDWKKLEDTGAIFLPAAGYYLQQYIYDVQYFGQYWTSTNSNDENAISFVFYSGGRYINELSKTGRRSVRLVKDCK